MYNNSNFYGSVQGVGRAEVDGINSQLDEITNQAVNVLSYGAVGDGVTSDSQSIQNAVNDADVIIFPFGKTYLMKNVRIPSNKTLLMYGATLKYGGNTPSENSIRLENESGIFFGYGTFDDYEENINFFGGNLIGNRISTAWGVDTTATYGIDLIQMSFINNIKIRDMSLSEVGQDGIELKSCINALIENCKFKNICDASIEIRGNGDTLIQGNKFYMVRNALFCKSHAEFNETNPTNITFKDNYCETFFSPVIFHETWNISIDGNKFLPIQTPDESLNGATSACINTANPPTFATISDIRDVKILNNHIEGFTGNIAIQIIRQTETSDVLRTTISGNTIKNCYKGVRVDGGSTITDNIFDTITSVGADDSCIAVKPFDLATVIIARNSMTSVNDGIRNMCVSGVLNIENNIHNGGRFAYIFHSCTDLKISNNNIKSTSAGIYCNGSNEVVVESNTIESGALPISSEGDNVIIKNNLINKTGAGAYYGIRIKGQDNVVCGNKIAHDGTNSPIEFLTGSSGGVVQGNEIINTGATSGIRLYANRISVIGNKTRGGSQGIRVHGNENVLNGNIIENATFQGIDIISGASKNIVTSNICLNNGTNFADAGTGTVIANNVTA